MKTVGINNSPRILAFTDGGYLDGLIYLQAPMNYEDMVKRGPGYSSDLANRGEYPTIICDLEVIGRLAEEEGADGEIVILEGPDRSGYDYHRHSKEVSGWFLGIRDAGIKTLKLQVTRGDLRYFWSTNLQDVLRDELEKLYEQSNPKDLISKIGEIRKAIKG